MVSTGTRSGGSFNYVHSILTTDQLKCDKEKPCKKCNRQHSTWLHEDRSDKGKTINNSHGYVMSTGDKEILLSTAMVQIDGHSSKFCWGISSDS